MQSVNPQINNGTFSDFYDLLFDLFTDFLNDFFNSCRMDPAVGDQTMK